MGKKSVVMLVVYALVMVAVVVGVDVTIFRNFMLARFLANVGIVLLFGAFYLRFLRP
jgi:uncharacterized membrane protein